MKIREAEVADAGRIAEVHVQSWIDTYSGLMPQEVLDSLSVDERRQAWIQSLEANDYTTFVVEAGGLIVGFVTCGATRDKDCDRKSTGEILAIYLQQNYQGKGFGRIMFDKARSDLARQGFEKFTLWVLESNLATRKFYEAMEMRVDGGENIDEYFGHGLKEVRYVGNVKLEGR